MIEMRDDPIDLGSLHEGLTMAHFPTADELLRIVAMSTNDGIWDWDLTTAHVYYSNRWLELVGKCPEAVDMHFDTFMNLLHEEDRPRVFQHIEDYLSGKKDEYRVEFRLAHHDGSWRWILSRGIMVRDASDNPVRIAGTHTDITYRVQEAQRLESLVAQRTRELQAARDRAESNAVATAKFLAATSHDVGQPLQAAALLLGSLHQEVHSAAGQNMLQAVEHSIQICMQLLESLLEFSQLDAGALHAQMENVTLGPLLNSLVSEFAAQAMRSRIQLRVVPARLMVSTDPRLLGRILRNLVSNALKYTSRGKVLVGCRRCGGKVRIEVWDTGCGIAPDQLQRIFHEFVRLPGSRSTSAPGLGLGLAIVQRLARLLGHQVTVRSWPGRGTVMAVELSVACMPLQQRLQLLLPARRVALLEDNTDIAKGLTRMLHSSGCRVWHGCTLPELLDKLDDTVPDILIADWHLDGPVDGFGAYDELERRYGPLPGLVLTGSYDLAQLKARNTARRKILFKPVTPAALLAVLRGLAL